MNDKLFNKINEFKDTQENLVVRYEEKKCWEIAYLAKWSILEYGVKQVVGFEKKRQLLEKLIEWKNYIEGESGVRPKKGIQGCTFECQSIPEMNRIRNILGNLPKMQEVLDPKGKYRNKRNNIAHRAEMFGRESTYLDYKNALEKAISELTSKAHTAFAHAKQRE